MASGATPSSGDRGTAAWRRAALARAAARRRAHRRRAAAWIGGGVGIVATATALVLGALVLTRGSPTAGARPSAVAGPEGVVLESGPPLATSTTSASGAPVDGIDCTATEQVAYHIHTHLAVYVNGAERSLPAGIGLVAPVPRATPQGAFDAASRCYYSLHVHARDGIIHVEAPTAAPVTLGRFLAVWRQPLTAGRVATATGRLTTYVDGRRVAGDPSRIVLRSREEIQIDVGANVPFHRVDWGRSGL